MKKIIGLFFVFTAVLMTSCLKEKDTIAEISIVDESGSPVAGAQVVLLGVPSITPHPEVIRHDTLTSNSAGKAVFDYTEEYKLGSAGFAILDIIVEKMDTVSATLIEGRGIINVKPQETSQEIVVMPCTGC